MGDAVDAAIAGSEPDEEAQLVQMKVRLGSGRAVLLAVPVDFTAPEAIDLVGYIARGLPEQLDQLKKAQPRILVPDRPQIIRP